MNFRLTRLQMIALFCLIGCAILLAFMPHAGAPHFRYSGSDPAHHVWNLGWPLATCIYDPATSPYLFVGPFAAVLSVTAIVGCVSVYGAFAMWNNRRLFQTKMEMKEPAADC